MQKILHGSTGLHQKFGLTGDLVSTRGLVFGNGKNINQEELDFFQKQLQAQEQIDRCKPPKSQLAREEYKNKAKKIRDLFIEVQI